LQVIIEFVVEPIFLTAKVTKKTQRSQSFFFANFA